MTGHAPGGVCPFGIKDGIEVYLDESLKRFETVYPAAGDDHSAVRLTIPELEEVSGAKGWVDVCREPPVVGKLNNGFIRGLYEVGDMKLYVNQGTDVWNGFLLRLGTVGEISLLTLKRAPETDVVAATQDK